MAGGPPPDGRTSLHRFIPAQESILSESKRLRDQPTVVYVLIFVVLFFGVLSGVSYVQMGDGMLGSAILLGAALAVVVILLVGKALARG
jgi:hypothetical protein